MTKIVSIVAIILVVLNGCTAAPDVIEPASGIYSENSCGGLLPGWSGAGNPTPEIGNLLMIQHDRLAWNGYEIGTSELSSLAGRVGVDRTPLIVIIEDSATCGSVETVRSVLESAISCEGKALCFEYSKAAWQTNSPRPLPK